jgi:glycosyltransferase involved in cell wall biosynthesis
MGLYVVSSPYNGGREVLQEETGYTIETLSSPDSMAAALSHALARPKSETRARAIRSSIEHLDHTTQIDQIVSETLAYS